MSVLDCIVAELQRQDELDEAPPIMDRAQDIVTALRVGSFEIMPTICDGVWPVTINHMADAFKAAFDKAHEHRGYYESFYAGYKAMLKLEV